MLLFWLVYSWKTIICHQHSVRTKSDTYSPFIFWHHLDLITSFFFQRKVDSNSRNTYSLKLDRDSHQVYLGIFFNSNVMIMDLSACKLHNLLCLNCHYTYFPVFHSFVWGYMERIFYSLNYAYIDIIKFTCLIPQVERSVSSCELMHETRVWSEYTERTVKTVCLGELCGVKYLILLHLLAMQNSKVHWKGNKKAVCISMTENLPRHYGSPSDWTELKKKGGITCLDAHDLPACRKEVNDKADKFPLNLPAPHSLLLSLFLIFRVLLLPIEDSHLSESDYF